MLLGRENDSVAVYDQVAGGYLNIEITKELLKSVKQSYQKYNAELEEKNRMKAAMAKKEQEEQSVKRKHENEESLEGEIARKRVTIDVTEEQIQDANTELQEILKSKTLSGIKLMKVNAQLSLAIQTLQTIAKDLHDLDNRTV